MRKWILYFLTILFLIILFPALRSFFILVFVLSLFIFPFFGIKANSNEKNDEQEKLEQKILAGKQEYQARRIAQQQIEVQNRIYSSWTKDFESVGWTRWGFKEHSQPGQLERAERACYSRTMKLLKYDPGSREAQVCGESGTVYKVNADGCSCPDFCVRKLPCKHMYFAVLEIDQ